MRLFSTLSPRRPAPNARQKLRAAVARRTARTPSIEEEEEPTTSFRTALVVVLLLHVVAGAGIVMFEKISSRHPAVATENVAKTRKAAAATAAAASRSAAAVAAAAQGTASAPSANTAIHPKTASAPVATPVEPARKTSEPVRETASSSQAGKIRDSGQIYIVAKGDTLVSISRRQKVTYEDLIKLNKIDDPKRLRIGQKLHLPAKTRASAN